MQPDESGSVALDFVELLVERVGDLLGKNAIEKVVGVKSDRGLFGLKSDSAALALVHTTDEDRKAKIDKLIGLMANSFGADLTDQHLQDIYTKLEKRHSPVLANSLILPLIPPEYLEKYRLTYLSK